MSDKTGYILLLYAFIVTTLLISVSSITLLDSFIYGDKYQSNIKYYENYYIATETLLDSLNIECNDSIFNTKVGRNYLIHKNKIDSIFYNSKKEEN